MTRSGRGAASFAAGTAGLREYWGTAVLAAVTGAAALAAVLPVTEFVTSAGGIASRLHLGTARSFDAGFLWLHSLGPPELRQAAVTFFSKLLFGVTAGVLVVALLTLLAVFVARASARGPEIAIRRAVGASSRHLLVAQLVEGAVVGAAAVLSGGAIGLMGGWLLGAAWPGSLGAPGGGVSAAAVLVLTAAILLGALLPAAIVRRPARSSAVDPTPLALVVPAAQLGLSLTVLAAASMLRLGAERIAPPEAAAKGEDQVYDISAAKLPASQRAAGYAELLRRLEADREVTFASLTSPGALVGLGRVALAAGESVFYTVHHLVSADSFQALGLRVVAGRGFADSDGWLAPRVAVVSRALAMRLVALRGTISLGYGPEAAHTVVGVVDDVQPVGLGGALAPRFVVYTSILQHPAGSVELLVRGARGKETVAGVRRAIGATLGASASESGPVSEAALFSAEAAPLHWFARVFGAEGWAMLAVATFGTFAVMWLWVTSLLGELGVRRAAGARRRDIMRFVLARAAGVAVAGIAFGAWVGMMVWGVLHTLSVTLPAWDPKAVVWSGLLLALAALAGAFLPAWRAAHTPPATLIQVGEGLQ